MFGEWVGSTLYFQSNASQVSYPATVSLPFLLLVYLVRELLYVVYTPAAWCDASYMVVMAPGRRARLRFGHSNLYISV